MKKRRRHGFTLVELLVVISIIALLMSILVPALSRARHIARRTVCASRIKDSIAALTSYAIGSGNGKLPLGAMGKSRITEYQRGLGWSQLDYMSEKSYKSVARYLKDTRTLMCTNISKHITEDERWAGGVPFIPSWNIDNDWPAYWIGYNYLGGHFAEAWNLQPPDSTTVEWRSPYRLEDPGYLPLLCCKTSQSSKGWRTFVSHSGRGPEYGEINQDPRDLAPNGSGNLGKLDGSVTCSAVRDMEKHIAANNFGKYPSARIFAFW